MTNMLGTAISIVATAFRDITDKGGHPYVLHCIRVMQAMPLDDHELRCIAVMHDLLEDTDWTIFDLYKQGFSSRVCVGVQALTHDKNTSRDDYIKRIALNPDATKVKIADLRDNSDITRLKGVSKKDFDRLEKYHKEYLYLRNV